jgi:TatD DNase family protein
MFDTHAHLAAPEYDLDLPEVLDRARSAGVTRILCVGTDLGSSRRCVDLARRYPDVIRAAVGIHPTSPTGDDAAELATLCQLAALPEVVAIGETGLDFYHPPCRREEQMVRFRRHIELARDTGKALIVHARRSDEEVLAELARHRGGLAGVRHCFERSAETARRYLEVGFHISLAAAVTREGYRKLKAAVADLPTDRLLVETDCPYQTPAPRASGRNEPAYLADTIRAVAVIRQMDPGALAALTARNAATLFAHV